MGLDIPGTRGL